MKERLQIIIDELLMSISAFARSIEVSDDTIRKILRGKQEMSSTVLKKMLETYPNISREWFEKGEGEMFLWKRKTGMTTEINEIASEYSKTCKNCADKDKEIAELKTKLIELQQLYIECLKEVSGLKTTASG